MTHNDQLQQKYQHFQLFQQQIEQLTPQVELLHQQQAELDLSLDALQELQKTVVPRELLAPLANGIFLRGELKDNQKLIVNVGSEIAVEKTVPQVIELLQQQLQDIAERVLEAEALLQQFTAQATKLYRELQKQVQEE